MAAAELLDAGTDKSPTYTADTDAWRSKAWQASKNTKPSSSQKPEVYNQHFPTLSDDEEKRLDQYGYKGYTRSKGQCRQSWIAQ